jgi:ribosomal protein L11 methyltransferase
LAKRWPALDVRGPLAPLSDEDIGLLVAAIDDYSPTAVEEREGGVRIFFAAAEARDGAAAVIATLKGSRYTRLRYTRLDISDEDWAERSQHNLEPVTVGRITILPAPAHEYVGSALMRTNRGRESSIELVVPPSMAFGTGHHATTRLCLAALQTIDLAGTFVIDVGTGSGVLALAAAALGAERAVGVDNDPDAVAAARDNLIRNPHVHAVEFRHEDFRDLALADADVVVANLTGALIASAAASLLAPLGPGGNLVISGVLAEEFESVAHALGDAVSKTWTADEDGWIGARLVKK